MDGTLTFVYDSLPVPIHHWNYEYNMQTLYSERAEAVLAQYPLSRFQTETYNGASCELCKPCELCDDPDIPCSSPTFLP